MPDRKRKPRSEKKPARLPRQKTLVELFKTPAASLEAEEGACTASDSEVWISSGAAPGSSSDIDSLDLVPQPPTKIKLKGTGNAGEKWDFSIFRRQSGEQKAAETSTVIHILEDDDDTAASETSDDPIALLPLADKRSTEAELPKTSLRVKGTIQTRPSTKRATQRALEGLCVTYPSEYNQHVHGTYGTFLAPPLKYDRRVRVVQQSLNITTYPPLPAVPPSHALNDYAPQRSYQPLASYQISADDDRSTIPLEHACHPAISRILNNLHPNLDSSSQQTWADKWRPINATEVLGNEFSATYLRDWLNALRLRPEGSVEALTPTSTPSGRPKASQGTKGTKRGLKRLRITRAVEKERRPKRRKLDSEEPEDKWMVEASSFCEEEEEEEEGIAETAYWDRGQRSSPMLAVGNTRYDHNFDSFLSNTIIISGPSGCGKTAAVYACAKELDWDVFEVYPGIGKRSGAGLESLVGEVGKNHTVGQQSAGAERTVQTQLEAVNESPQPRRLGRKSKNGKKIKLPPESSPIHGDVELEKLTTVMTRTTTEIRQSFVLLEEVDILFKDDLNFWPTVVNLIKDCKRAVIMTCNDISLVPVDDLPIQTVLEFQPPSTELAVSFFQSMCLTEGHSIERARLSDLYESTQELQPLDIPDGPINPFSDGLPWPDFRKTIHQLQFRLLNASQQETPHGSEAVKFALDEAPAMSKIVASILPDEESEISFPNSGQADIQSFVDSYLTCNPWDGPDMSGMPFEPSNDDELGHSVLSTSVGAGARELQCCQEMIAETAIRLSRGSLAAQTRTGLIKTVDDSQHRFLFRDRVEFQTRLLVVLGSFIPIYAPLMPRPAIFLDYEPWIRQIIRAEDAHVSGGLRRNDRPTRAAKSVSKYYRVYEMSMEQQSALARTRLGGTASAVVDLTPE